MRAVPLCSFSIIKIPVNVNPATLDAWEDLLIHEFKPSLNYMGIQTKSPTLKIHAALGIQKPPSTLLKSDLNIGRNPLIHRHP